MNDVIAYLNASLDEDERKALDAAEINGDDWELGPSDVLTGKLTGILIATSPYGDGLESTAGQHIARHHPARVLREVEVVRRVISDYRSSDGALIRGNYDHDDPGWRGIRAGRDAFKSVLMAYAKAAGWEG